MATQSGSVKKVVIVTSCFLLVVIYYFGYKPVHSIAQHVVHNQAVARQQAAAATKAQKASQLEGKLTTAWRGVLTTTPPDGNVDIAAYDNATGATAEYTNAPSGTTYDTASIIKMSILETLLLQNQKNHISGLTSTQLAEATPMIENSDNDAATDLWNLIGQAAAVNAFFAQIGTTHSTANAAWGLTETTALDQLKVVNQVAYPTLLDSASISAADNLLDNVESDQHWGVSGGVPSGVSVRLKNGWLQGDGSDFNGWEINSIGHVDGEGTNYTIAVLTSNNNTEQDGINTIQALSTATWQTVSTAAKSS